MTALLATLTLGTAVLVPAPARAEAHGPRVGPIGVIDMPTGSQLFGLAVSESQGKLYVTDDNSGLLTVIDTDTHAALSTIQVGSYATELVVSERRNKLYVASNTNPFTTGIDPGTGLISVIDTVTDTPILTINVYHPRQPPVNSGIQLLLDDAHDRVYVLFRDPFEPGIGYINTVTNEFTLVPGSPSGPPNIWTPTFNELSQQLLIANIRDNVVHVYDARSGQLSEVDLDPTGTAQPLDIVTNRDGTKWYIHVNAPNATTLVLDRLAGTHRVVGEGDMLPLAFNNRTNRLFLGIQIGTRGGLMDGTTDHLDYVQFTNCGSTCGFGVVKLSPRTDNAYFASSRATYVLNGRSAAFTRFAAPATRTGGGVVIQSIAINQKTGRVYIVNDDQIPKIAVYQDPRPAQGDFDGDRDADVAVFRPSNGAWFVKNQFSMRWGTHGDVPVPADYDGDGDTDVGVFRPSNGAWFVKDQFSTRWGMPGDIPVPADYDGDGDADVAVFRPSDGAWFVKDHFALRWGRPGDIPVPADYDGDGDADVAFYRPSTGEWHIGGSRPVPWGGARGDVPVPADYDGDGDADIAIYRPSSGAWFVRGLFRVLWGGHPSDLPVPADYDGDGDADVAVYRESRGEWRVKDQSTTRWGIAGDRPLPLPWAVWQYARG